MKTMLLCLAMLFPAFAVGHQELPAIPTVVFLEPNSDTIKIENLLTARADCSPWPIDSFRPRQFFGRGQILDAAGRLLGRYQWRGVINNLDGSHVAQYALTFNNVGTVVYTLDTSPEVFPYEVATMIAFGAREGAGVEILASPSLRPGCVWNLNWQIRINVEAQQ